MLPFRSLRRIAGFLAVLASASAARAQFYSMAPVAPALLLGTGLNENGAVVGYGANPNIKAGDAGFLYSGGVLVNLGSLGGNTTYAMGINDAGIVVGGSYDSDGNENAYAYSDGAMKDLGTLGGSFSRAMAINNAGQIVGFSEASNLTYHAFLYTLNGMFDLGTLGGSQSSAVAINSSGQIVGVSSLANGQNVAYLYSNGMMQSLGTNGGSASQAAAINSSGVVVGSIVDTNNFLQAFVYADGKMTMLGTLGGSMSEACGINDAGLIVGASYPAGDTNLYAFVYSNGVMTDLNTLVNNPTVLLSGAGAVNNQGQILAQGWDNQCYLLTPSSIPPPTPTPAPPPVSTLAPTPAPTPTPITAASPGPSPVPSPPPPTPVPTLASNAVTRSTTGTQSAAVPASRVTNVSCRAYVGTGSSVAVAGFVISGTATEQVLIRGVGPALTQFSVAAALAQPVLTVFNSAGTQLASNTGWGTNADPQQVSAAFGATGAFALPSGSPDSALLLSLAPGSYTAEVSGLNNTTGNALIEVYEMPSTP